MNTKKNLSYITDIIHTTVAATVEDENLPVTAAIDRMDSAKNSFFDCPAGAAAKLGGMSHDAG